MTRAFDAVNRHLGWGEPHRGLWFVALEEADEWTGSEEAVIEAAERLGEVSPPVDDPQLEAVAKGEQLRAAIARIASAVSRDGRHKGGDWYLKNRLWRRGTKVFHANLYPLGRPTHDSWPASFKALFGLSSDDRIEYKRVLASTRFPRLAALRRESQPIATICFGKDEWPVFRSICGVASPYRELAGGKAHVYDGERVVLMHFPSRGNVSAENADEVGRVLCEWGAEIP